MDSLAIADLPRRGAECAQWLSDVLHRVLAKVIESRLDTIQDRAVHGVRNDDASQLSQRLQARGNVDAVAVGRAVELLDHVPEMHTHTELHAPRFGKRCREYSQLRLYRKRRVYRTCDRVEHRQHRIARHVDDTAAVGPNLLAEYCARSIQRCHYGPVVSGHQARIARRVGGQNGQQPMAIVAVVRDHMLLGLAAIWCADAPALVRPGPILRASADKGQSCGSSFGEHAGAERPADLTRRSRCAYHVQSGRGRRLCRSVIQSARPPAPQSVTDEEPRMSQTCRLIFLLCVGLTVGSGEAKTLNWGAKGDALSMDPYAFNEGLTNSINSHVYDTLVDRDRNQRIVPRLASSWTALNDTTWRFALRRDAKFHDGTPVTAADVVFSIERSQQPTSQQAVFTRSLGKASIIDDYTIELRLEVPNPVLLEHAQSVFVMSRAWCVAHKLERVPDFNAKEEAFSTRNAMGSGPFILKHREPGVRTVLSRNPNWWGRFDGNVSEVVLTPIANDATRTAALLAGDVNFIQEAPPRDMTRLEKEASVRLTTGPENRVIYFGFDQYRDQLQYSNVKGSNPFKDRRVREAFFRAVDAEAIRSRIMRNQSVPTACMTTAAIGCLASELETRPPVDVGRARELMAEAGYAQGFEVTLDCPNDRYINDEAICVALVPMLARIGVALKVDARPKSLFFPKILNFDTSFYLVGWGGGTTDAQIVMDPILRGADKKTQKGGDNLGRYDDPELNRLIDAAAIEMNADKRASLIRDVLRRTFDQFYYLPIHRQMLTWASRAKVRPVIVPSNVVNARWIEID